MQDLAVNLGIDVLFKGTNFIRLLGGLWTALWISLVSVAISIPLGIGMGVLMTKKNRILKAVLRVYLEFIRIMPQLVLLRNDKGFRLGSFGRSGLYNSIRIMGHCRNGRPCKRRTYLNTEASV